MLFIKVDDGVVNEISESQVNNLIKEQYKISVRNLSEMPTERYQEWLNKLSELGVYEVILSPEPWYDPSKEKLGDYEIVNIEGVWTKKRSIVTLSQADLDIIANKLNMAYEKDLLDTAGVKLILYMNGDITESEFKDSVTAVKTIHGRS